jgi:hypothetical protein
MFYCTDPIVEQDTDSDKHTSLLQYGNKYGSTDPHYQSN